MSNQNVPASDKNSEELSLFKQQDEHQFQLALKTLEANVQNQREMREHFGDLAKRDKRNAFCFIMLFTCLFFGFGFYALTLGKEEFLADVLKVLVGAFGGGGIGFVYGIRHQTHSQRSSQELPLS